MSDKKCSICGSTAAVFLRAGGDDDRACTVSLCESCARQYGVYPVANVAPFMVRSNVNAEIFNKVSAGAQTVDDICAYCGTSIQSIQDTHRVGCIHCYQQLSDKICSFLREQYTNNTIERDIQI